MSAAIHPQRWADDLTLLLNAVLGENRFPVNVPEVAREFSLKRSPDDPITLVRGDVLPGFDGALTPRAPTGKKGWGIFYNTSIGSTGRINFTLAHEFGHYLMHRHTHPNGIRCGDQDVGPVGIPNMGSLNIRRMCFRQSCSCRWMTSAAKSLSARKSTSPIYRDVPTATGCR